MQIKLLLATLLFTGTAITAMEQTSTDLKMLTEISSLKLLAAWQASNSKDIVTIKEVGDEDLIDLLNDIACLPKEERKFFKALLSNPNLDVKNFPKLLNKYFPRESINNIDKQKLLNFMLINAPKFYNKLAVKILLQAGADVNFQDGANQTPPRLCLQWRTANLIL